MTQISQDHLEASQEASQNNPEETLHELRKSIDAIIKWTGKLKENRKSGYGREISLVYTRLQESKMWAGQCLGAIGSPFPEHLRDEADPTSDGQLAKEAS